MCSLILSVHWLSFLYSVICLSIGCHFCIVLFVCWLSFLLLLEVLLWSVKQCCVCSRFPHECECRLLCRCVYSTVVVDSTSFHTDDVIEDVRKEWQR